MFHGPDSFGVQSQPSDHPSEIGRCRVHLKCGTHCKKKTIKYQEQFPWIATGWVKWVTSPNLILIGVDFFFPFSFFEFKVGMDLQILGHAGCGDMFRYLLVSAPLHRDHIQLNIFVNTHYQSLILTILDSAI